MNDTGLIYSLKNLAQKHRIFYIPIMLLLFIILLFYKIIVIAAKNARKVLALLLGFIILLFANSYTLLSFDKDEVYNDQVFIRNDNGLFALENMDDEKISATEDDIREFLKKRSNSGIKENIDPGHIDADTIVYDETIGQYVKPDFEKDWSLILVNKQYPIDDSYKFELGTIKGDIKSDIRIMESVLGMLQAAREDGVILYICSPYRDYDRQVMLFNRKVNYYIKQGYNSNEAYELASETVAVPGTSEHQIGLAFDFISNDYQTLDAGFARTDAGIWLKNNAADYGFILRYPEDKVNITDIEYEPWHYRYVGNTAHEIMDNGLCLEEYVKKIGLLD